MPVTAALRRLLRVRNLQDEQHRLALESALADLHVLEQALARAGVAERRGRALLASSAPAGNPADRIGALVESWSAARHADAVRPRIVAVKQETVRLRQQYLLKRTERRQAETLIGEREAQDAIAAVRRQQQGLDNWFSSRASRDKSSRNARSPHPSEEEL